MNLEGFETFERGVRRGGWGKNDVVTISPIGSVRIAKELWKQIGSPKHIRVMVNTAERRIALVSAQAGDVSAFAVSIGLMSLRRLQKQYDIKAGEYPAKIQGNAVVFTYESN